MWETLPFLGQPTGCRRLSKRVNQVAGWHAHTSVSEEGKQ